MHNPIAAVLSSITLGEPVTYENLTMVPLIGPGSVEREPHYLTLDEAIAQAWTDVTEISEHGSVPELRVLNKGPKPVFILDGEELLGAKQNRVVNLTILVPATTMMTIPVSCVEAGRWRSRSRTFATAPRTQYAAGRAKRMAQVTQSMQTNRSYAADQADVWADIAAKSERLAASSPTSAMQEMFSVHLHFTEGCVEALGPVPQQCGALFLVNGEVVGFDLFDSAITLCRLLPKLVRSVALDALDRSGDQWALGQEEQTLAEQFLAVVAAAPVHVAPAAEAGHDVRVVHTKIAGAARSWWTTFRCTSRPSR